MNNDENVILGDYDITINGYFFPAFSWFVRTDKPRKYYSVYSGEEIL